MTPEGVGVYNPAFDVTDHDLVTAIITERGIATIEEMVVVTDEGADYLSTPQKELWLI